MHTIESSIQPVSYYNFSEVPDWNFQCLTSKFLSILAYDPTITEWDLYYWFTEAKPYPKELIKDESYIADYAKEEIQGMVLNLTTRI